MDKLKKFVQVSLKCWHSSGLPKHSAFRRKADPRNTAVWQQCKIRHRFLIPSAFICARGQITAPSTAKKHVRVRKAWRLGRNDMFQSATIISRFIMMAISPEEYVTNPSLTKNDDALQYIFQDAHHLPSNLLQETNGMIDDSQKEI